MATRDFEFLAFIFEVLRIAAKTDLTFVVVLVKGVAIDIMVGYRLVALSLIEAGGRSVGVVKSRRAVVAFVESLFGFFCSGYNAVSNCLALVDMVSEVRVERLVAGLARGAKETKSIWINSSGNVGLGNIW